MQRRPAAANVALRTFEDRDGRCWVGKEPSGAVVPLPLPSRNWAIKDGSWTTPEVICKAKPWLGSPHVSELREEIPHQPIRLGSVDLIGPPVALEFDAVVLDANVF